MPGWAVSGSERGRLAGLTAPPRPTGRSAGRAFRNVPRGKPSLSSRGNWEQWQLSRRATSYLLVARRHQLTRSQYAESLDYTPILMILITMILWPFWSPGRSSWTRPPPAVANIVTWPSTMSTFWPFTSKKTAPIYGLRV